MNSTPVLKKFWIEIVGGIGYAAKGIVYGLLGFLVFQAAYRGGGGEVGGKEMVLDYLSSLPLGELLLLIITIGLISYVLWRLIQAVLNPGNDDSGAKSVIQRIGYVLSALTYSGLAFICFKFVIGSGSGDSDTSKKQSAAWLMEQPYGRTAVVLIGAIIICVGLFYLYRSYKATFVKKLAVEKMSGAERTWIVRFGRTGIAARAIIFGIIGFLIVKSGLQSSTGEVGGYGNALRELAQQSYGPWLLGAVAGGLILYGIYCLFLARYLKLRSTG
ncbi:MAG: DUF1206 domain-containing protein [Deltaproteobacteria bacterium]